MECDFQCSALHLLFFPSPLIPQQRKSLLRTLLLYSCPSLIFFPLCQRLSVVSSTSATRVDTGLREECEVVPEARKLGLWCLPLKFSRCLRVFKRNVCCQWPLVEAREHPPARIKTVQGARMVSGVASSDVSLRFSSFLSRFV